MIQVQGVIVTPAWCFIPVSQGYVQQHFWTTAMLKNIPNDYTQEMLLQLLDAEGFVRKCDFMYFPIDFKSGSAFGYAFVNLVTAEDALHFQFHFNGFDRWAFPSRKVAEVVWSQPMQGLEAAIARYRNSSVMSEHVPECFKPCVLHDGVRIRFPPPTVPISLPRTLAESLTAQRYSPSSATLGRMDGTAPEPSYRTTLMIRNVPNDYDRSMLLALIDEGGFKGKYDFVYLPIDFASGACLGYSFINMLSHQDAECFRIQFTGFNRWAMPSHKVAEVVWSDSHQGLAAQVSWWRNSAVMHHSTPDKFKPVLFANGVRVRFPPPTMDINTPQSASAREQGQGVVYQQVPALRCVCDVFAPDTAR